MAPERAQYTDAQLEAYLERIAYSPADKSTPNLVEEARARLQNDPLEILSELQKLHLAAIPWGNSSLHYSQHHTISLHPDSLYEKMVERRLDGYCMESTGLFFTVLRSLGYHVYATGGRVSPATSSGIDTGLFASLGHMILIVIVDDARYMVDVGFGINCATAPLPLQEGATATCIAPSEMRLVKETPIEFIDKSQKIWIYQTRKNPESPWLPGICFSEVEFLPQDFEVMNFSVSQRRTSWFTHQFVCVRMIMDPASKEIIGQCIISGKEAKKRIGGETQTLQVLENEEDRVHALGKYFGVHLRKHEIEGIRGFVSELK
ncbi:Uncharacterized protein PECH_008134 [Penicillium ucsense]|uniref:Arylamine N-acetyltransferase n=1 Tax=Penicillium ucsense TaxID=2839758 RepID=A0A8J8WME7_9EURO|nr:Uncharacterized protein PECM_003313 [Penicillium ucsense]KAF7738763.1 Uncharacterized protein PECH_008134 [Penicillium ucsense]